MQKCDISAAKARDVMLDRDCVDSAVINRERLSGCGFDDCHIAVDAVGATALATASVAVSNR